MSLECARQMRLGYCPPNDLCGLHFGRKTMAQSKKDKLTPKEREAVIRVAIAAKVFLFGPGTDDQRRAENLVDACFDADMPGG